MTSNTIDIDIMLNFRYNIIGGRMQRYFAKNKINNEFILNDDDMRHIKLVMRMKDNDEIIVVDSKKPYLCYLSNDKVIIKEELKEDINFPYVCLIVPILKENKMDYILQKSTEMGVSEIITYYAERSVIKETNNNAKKIDRWVRIMKEASEQSHRLDIPKISIKKLNELDLEGKSIICTTHEKQENLKNILKSINIYDRINIVIGPEGGFSNLEEELLIKSFIPVTLGQRILRVETVPLFVMSIINYEIME